MCLEGTQRAGGVVGWGKGWEKMMVSVCNLADLAGAQGLGRGKRVEAVVRVVRSSGEGGA